MENSNCDGSHCKAALRYLRWIAVFLASLITVYSSPLFIHRALADPPPHFVYDNTLQWSNWSWRATVDQIATSQVYSGASSLKVTFNRAWAGLSLYTPGFDTTSYSSLSFVINYPGGQSPSSLNAGLYDSDGKFIKAIAIAPYASPADNGWYRVDIPLTALGGGATTITRLHLQDTTGDAQPTFYIDDLRFAPGSEPLPTPPSTEPSPKPPSTRSTKYIALTIDDGPSKMAMPILDRLAARGVRVTMFVTGESASRHPDAIRRMVTEGHVIGNHSWNHPDLTTLILSDLIDQLSRTNKILRDLGAPAPRLFRPPFGKSSSEIVKNAEDMGMTSTLWSADALDWSRNKVSADQLCKNVVRGASPGGIILMHDLDFNKDAPDAIDCVVDTLRSQGFEFGRIVPSNEWNDAIGSNARVVPW